MLTANQVLQELAAMPPTQEVVAARAKYQSMGMQWASGIERVERGPGGAVKLIEAAHSADIGMVSIRPDGSTIKMWYVLGGERELIETMPLAKAKADPKTWQAFLARARSFMEGKK